MSKLLLYVHFNRLGELSEHVTYQIQQLKPLFDKVVLISNSPLSPADERQLTALCNTVIQRENIGFDFAAWRDGIEHIGWDELKGYDSVTTMNDTCFGPLYPIKDTYDAMQQRDLDFWGITDHSENPVGMPGTGGPVPRHIQSYFTVFNHDVVASKVFQDFWEGVNNYTNVTRVIQEYETQLTGLLHKAGFAYDVLFDTTDYSSKHGIKDLYNYSELLPLVMIKQGVPLLKVKVFVHTHRRRVLRSLRCTNYPLKLIEDHLERMQVTNANTLRVRLRRVVARVLRYVPGYIPARLYIRKKFDR